MANWCSNMVLVVVSCCFTVCLLVCISIIEAYRFTMIDWSASSIGSHGNDFMPFLPELV